MPIFFYTFYVMLPAQQIALAAGASKEEADTIAWMAGVLAGLGSGLIELVGAWVAPTIRKMTPRAALLSALAAVGLFFIAADYTFRAYTYPAIGLPTFFLTLYLLYGGVRLRWNLSGGLLVLILGSAIAWELYRGQASQRWLLGCVVVLPVVIGFFVQQGIPFLHPRFFLYTTPALCLLAALGLTRLGRAGAIPALLLAVSWGVALPTAYTPFAPPD